jgi:hypothetical protein
VAVSGDAHGNVYIADVDGSRVHFVTSEGKYGGEVLSNKDGLREPLAIHWADDGHVILTQSNGDVKIFAL